MSSLPALRIVQWSKTSMRSISPSVITYRCSTLLSEITFPARSRTSWWTVATTRPAAFCSICNGCTRESSDPHWRSQYARTSAWPRTRPPSIAFGQFDLRMHSRESALDVAGVERVVGAAQHLLVLLAHRRAARAVTVRHAVRCVPGLDVGAHDSVISRAIASGSTPGGGRSTRRCVRLSIALITTRAESWGSTGRERGSAASAPAVRLTSRSSSLVELRAECRGSGSPEEHTVKARRERVQRDRRAHDVREHLVKARPVAQPPQVRFERCCPLSEVAVHERYEDRVLVGEVLVERADLYPGPFGDPVGGPGGIALALENLSRRLEDRLDGRPRARLLGEPAWLKTPAGNAS